MPADMFTEKNRRFYMDRGFLPATREEWDRNYGGQPDFVYIIGDAYVDHPSFGPAIISRVLESRG